VDSTVGLQMAYLKSWAARSHQPLRLRLPALLDGGGSASCMDAGEAASEFAADLAYLDPPYNQHSYLGNYHVWESLVRWDRPEVYGVAMKREDVRTRPSAFNRRGRHAAALRDVLERLRVRYLVVSFSDEGFLALDELRAMLAGRGRVREVAVVQPRHIGHRIGIHDLRGRKVGTPGPAHNREHLFVVECGAAAIRRAVRRAPAALRAPAAPRAARRAAPPDAGKRVRSARALMSGAYRPKLRIQGAARSGRARGGADERHFRPGDELGDHAGDDQCPGAPGARRHVERPARRVPAGGSLRAVDGREPAAHREPDLRPLGAGRPRRPGRRPGLRVLRRPGPSPTDQMKPAEPLGPAGLRWVRLADYEQPIELPQLTQR
jgi:hypothetical protein